MPKKKVSIVTRSQKNNIALKRGDVSLPDFDLEFEEVPVLVHGFRRMVRELAYDVCEMALTTYLCAREHGVPITAIPVFLVRDIHHDRIVQNLNAGLTGPRDLETKTVAVNRGYTVTSGVWARTILETDFGVDLGNITWAPSSDEHVAEFINPTNVRPLEGCDYEGAVVSGIVPAGLGASIDNANVAPLIENAFDAGIAAVASGRLYPINHLVVIKNDLLDQVPEIAPQMFEAFSQSKRLYVDDLKAGRVNDLTRADKVHIAALENMNDPLPYGIETNQETLESLIQQAMSQEILRKPVSVSDVFAQSTWDLLG